MRTPSSLNPTAANGASVLPTAQSSATAPGAPAPSRHFTLARILFSIRARFNPIRELTPETLARALDLFHGGYLRPAALLWDAMERRDDVLQGVAGKRKKAVARLQWEILTTDDSREAAQQREALEFFYSNLTATHACDPQERGGLSLLIKQMMDAMGKKYAVHEVVWQRRPAPANGKTGGPRTLLTATFRFAPLWFFEARTGRLRYLTEDTAVEGVEMEPSQWLITLGDGLMESCSIAYLFKHLPLRDWLVYCERNGMPGVRGVTEAAPGTPEWDAAREAVRDFGAEFNALMSQGTAIEAIDLSTKGELPYPALIERMDRAMAALWRGADLSTMAKGHATGATLQADETEVLEQDDASLIAETLNAQVDAVVLRELFGNEPRQDTARRNYLDLVERLVKLGVPVTLAGLHERLGLPRPAPDQPLVKQTPMAATPVVPPV
jgi:phage gp29-like protein